MRVSSPVGEQRAEREVKACRSQKQGSRCRAKEHPDNRAVRAHALCPREEEASQQAHDDARNQAARRQGQGSTKGAASMIDPAASIA